MYYDAHARPPESMRVLFKKWQKAPVVDINDSDAIVDLVTLTEAAKEQVDSPMDLPRHVLTSAFRTLVGDEVDIPIAAASCYHIKALPGALDLTVQVALLDRLLHRDLANEVHKTNIHLHYDIPYSLIHQKEEEECEPHTPSFFRLEKEAKFTPRDPTVHKELSTKQVLDRKLRWVTLGGQYDWTAKVYPVDEPPAFPPDIASFLRTIWPDVDAQAAIVNFYTPGDTLSVHRDVSEECDRGLISVSIGCDAVFIIGNHDGSHHVTLRLRSGDAVLMSGNSRFAWHAVPRILPDTCPTDIDAWPATATDTRPTNSNIESWSGWMKNKRINLNVRQMRSTVMHSEP